jgi:YfiR/HmsC-like
VLRLLLAAGLTLAASGVTTAQSATGAVLTAAFLFNFAKFTEWPADAPKEGPLTICVSGDPDVVSALERIVKGRPLAGRDVAASNVPDGDWRSCHVLFLTGLDAGHSQRIVDELKGVPVLTVSDRERFAEAGGIVGLVVDAGKIRFKINTDAAERAHLHLSSRVLILATIVKDGTGH